MLCSLAKLCLLIFLKVFKRYVSFLLGSLHPQISRIVGHNKQNNYGRLPLPLKFISEHILTTSNTNSLLELNHAPRCTCCCCCCCIILFRNNDTNHLPVCNFWTNVACYLPFAYSLWIIMCLVQSSIE
jgi:streptolysin S family bacteriocin protoxin